jgi:hypothetical protein
MNDNISVDALFPNKCNNRRTGNIDIESLYQGTAILNGVKNKFTSDDLLENIIKTREKKLTAMIDQYNKCCRAITDANNNGLNYIKFSVPTYSPGCSTYSSIDTLEYISDNLRKNYLDTAIIDNITIFINWEDIEFKKELAKLKKKVEKDND